MSVCSALPYWGRACEQQQGGRGTPGAPSCEPRAQLAKEGPEDMHLGPLHRAWAPSVPPAATWGVSVTVSVDHWEALATLCWICIAVALILNVVDGTGASDWMEWASRHCRLSSCCPGLPVITSPRLSHSFCAGLFAPLGGDVELSRRV